MGQCSHSALVNTGSSGTTHSPMNYDLGLLWSSGGQRSPRLHVDGTLNHLFIMRFHFIKDYNSKLSGSYCEHFQHVFNYFFASSNCDPFLLMPKVKGHGVNQCTCITLFVLPICKRIVTHLKKQRPSPFLSLWTDYYGTAVRSMATGISSEDLLAWRV